MNLQTSQARWLFFVDSIKLLSGTVLMVRFNACLIIASDEWVSCRKRNDRMIHRFSDVPRCMIFRHSLFSMPRRFGYAPRSMTNVRLRHGRTAMKDQHFAAFILDVETWLLEDAQGPQGFAGLGLDGHISSLYVRSNCVRQGVGKRLRPLSMSKRTSHSSRLHGSKPVQ